MEEGITKETWNKKKIIVALLALLLLTIVGFYFRANYHDDLTKDTKAVRGVSMEEKQSVKTQEINLQEVTREKIEDLKEEVSNLNIVEIASSSPQVQKILNDIKSLREYPENHLKEVCRKICGL